ncbi:MAG: ATP-binding cassette domain-containing protein [Negativicutes bacterium]|nr:ATP-binding cassette domain-containing protein [Negativicutes bacterium]
MNGGDLPRPHHCAGRDSGCSRLCCTKVEDFTVRRGQRLVLDGVNLHVHCGELTAIVGPNGAGKSTLLRAIIGEISHDGRLHYLDQKGKRSGRPLIGYVPQQLTFDPALPISVGEMFAAALAAPPCWLWRSRQVGRQIRMALDRVGVGDLINRPIGQLSGGEWQRVLLAMALEPLPDLLLLDEPGAAVDRAGSELFHRLVSRLREDYDLSIILVSHDLSMVARYADRVTVLAAGRVVASGPAGEVLGRSEVEQWLGGCWP